ncbi:MAG: hypothetical protein HRU33_14290 [Rhodobacteraceae bacterium]|nr:hypothetical protein [Paracoccaceae bacterium]
MVEVDFRGLHISLLSLEAGVQLTGDPYDVSDRLLGGVPARLQRDLIKKLVLTAINAGTKDAAFKGLRDGFSTGHAAKTLTNVQLETLLAAFLERSPHLAGLLFKDHGVRLMYLDSQISEWVHRHFSDQGVPVLSVHDSYLIDYTRVGELKRVMAVASEAVAGAALPTANEYLGLDEWDPTAEHFQDYVA